MVQCISGDAWVIVDDLLGAGEHEMRLHWLLPDFPFEVIAASPFHAVLATEKARFRWHVFSSSQGDAGVVRGGKSLMGDAIGADEELLGWESPTYGERCPAISLLYRVHAPLPVRIVTAILAGEAIQLQQSGRELVWSRSGSEVHQVSLVPVPSVGAGS
jgi:hypothetical protein